jgi:hypothetical protein
VTDSAARLLPENRSALKEWASIEVALEQGATVLMVRKGGIYEQKLGFQVEHRQFWLFPTLFHQGADELAPAFEWAIRAAEERVPAAGTLRIANYAEVTDALRVESFAALERIAGLHPLSPATVHARFHYKRRPYLHVLVVRVHRLQTPLLVPNREAYDGCVSWVELEEPLSTAAVTPVLSDREFEERRGEVLERLSDE